MSIFKIQLREEFMDIGKLTTAVLKRGVGGYLQTIPKVAGINNTIPKVAAAAATGSKVVTGATGAAATASKVVTGATGAAATGAKTADIAKTAEKVTGELDKADTVIKAGNKLNLDELGESGDVAKRITQGEVPAVTKAQASELQKITSESWDSFKTWVKNNPKTFAGIAGLAVIASGIAIAAQISADKKNSNTYNITGIEDISISKTYLAKITFSPNEKISTKDTVSFENTNCNPPLPPECTISKIISDSQIEVVIPAKLVTNGTSGNMKIKTKFSSEFNSILKDTVSAVTETATSTAAGVVAAGASGGAGLAGGVLKGLGLGDFVQYWWVLLIVCLLCMSSSSAIFIFMKFS